MSVESTKQRNVGWKALLSREAQRAEAQLAISQGRLAEEARRIVEPVQRADAQLAISQGRLAEGARRIVEPVQRAAEMRGALEQAQEAERMVGFRGLPWPEDSLLGGRELLHRSSELEATQRDWLAARIAQQLAAILQRADVSAVPGETDGSREPPSASAWRLPSGGRGFAPLDDKLAVTVLELEGVLPPISKAEAPAHLSRCRRLAGDWLKNPDNLKRMAGTGGFERKLVRLRDALKRVIDANTTA